MVFPLMSCFACSSSILLCTPAWSSSRRPCAAWCLSWSASCLPWSSPMWPANSSLCDERWPCSSSLCASRWPLMCSLCASISLLWRSWASSISSSWRSFSCCAFFTASSSVQWFSALSPKDFSRNSMRVSMSMCLSCMPLWSLWAWRFSSRESPMSFSMYCTRSPSAPSASSSATRCLANFEMSPLSLVMSVSRSSAVCLKVLSRFLQESLSCLSTCARRSSIVRCLSFRASSWPFLWWCRVPFSLSCSAAIFSSFWWKSSWLRPSSFLSLWKLPCRFLNSLMWPSISSFRLLWLLCRSSSFPALCWWSPP
mmetsp:Transcript_19075/g.57232  ORF Transcript_19075/g.57232 Transcript_19075/m.57232 type:complete len:311 (-) Transcript_19075:579-1511(-)